MSYELYEMLVKGYYYQVMRKDDLYMMFYVGFWDEDTAQIGIARSTNELKLVGSLQLDGCLTPSGTCNGVTGWERHPGNPTIAPSKDEWDGDACYKPFTIFVRSTWRMWYNGRKGALEQIGLVTHLGEDLRAPQ
jgi:hypothetical protein